MRIDAVFRRWFPSDMSGFPFTLTCFPSPLTCFLAYLFPFPVKTRGRPPPCLTSHSDCFFRNAFSFRQTEQDGSALDILPGFFFSVPLFRADRIPPYTDAFDGQTTLPHVIVRPVPTDPSVRPIPTDPSVRPRPAGGAATGAPSRRQRQSIQDRKRVRHRQHADRHPLLPYFFTL